MKISTFRLPVVGATVLVSATAALVTLFATPRSSTAGTVGVAGVGVVALATIGAAYGALRGARLLAISAAILLAIGHGLLLSPQIGAAGQPAVAVVGLVLSVLLIVIALDEVTSRV